MSSSVRFCACAPAPFRPLSFPKEGDTVTRFEPRLRIVFWTLCDAPFPTLTIAITAATPMMTPSIVSAERSLFTTSDCSAERKES